MQPLTSPVLSVSSSSLSSVLSHVTNDSVNMGSETLRQSFSTHVMKQGDGRESKLLLLTTGGVVNYIS